MLIIGHRGARGLETENTLKSFKKALELGVDGVEFDAWTTKDGIPVVSHDSDLVRMTGFNGQIFDMTYARIQKHKTADGQRILTAQEVIDLVGKKIIFLEIKDYYLSPAMLKLLDDNAKANIQVTSFRHDVLLELKQKRPELKLCTATSWHPLETISLIRDNSLYGLTLNYRSFNPFIYWLGRRYGIKIRLYTVNSPLYVRLLKRLGFKVDICTDRPDLFVAK